MEKWFNPKQVPLKDGMGLKSIEKKSRTNGGTLPDSKG
jgi:hypothetical protein